jgi:hypothetical protein
LYGRGTRPYNCAADKTRQTASRSTQIAIGLTTAIGSILWNWSIEFNRSTTPFSP